MRSNILNKKKEELEKELEKLEEKQKFFLEQNTFKLKTNTAYLQNMKVFDGWEDFLAWVQIKHDQHWDGENDSGVEVTFKLKKKKCVKTKENRQ